MSKLSATEIAYLMVAFQQAVLAVGWLLGALWVPDGRAALRWWAAFASLSALGLLLFVISAVNDDDLLRALGNPCAVGALISLQRGVRRFFDAPSPWPGHVAVMLAAILISWFGLPEAATWWRVAGTSALLAWLGAATTWDVLRRVRQQFDMRYGILLVLPLLLGTSVFVVRGMRSIVSPEVAVWDPASSNTANFVGVAVYMLVALITQLTLVALVASRLTIGLRHASRRDELTGLLNRRAIDEALAAEAQRARRLHVPFTVLMLDLDHFKSINDHQGHAAGDRALQHLATLFASQMRDIDRVGRYGGEEFLMLLPGTPLAQAHPLAERLREKVAALPPVWRDSPLPVTVSIGLAEWLGDRDDVGLLVARADAALYRAKQDGRNRVVTEHGALSELPACDG
jgi:diguanylate cyclase (GGDEF)-like protein